MKKKFLLVGGALAVGALALSSCGGTKTRERAKSKELPAASEFLDVSLTYGSNLLFITADQNFNNPIENNAAYTKGQSLLPVWKKFASVLSESEKYGVGTSVTIRDGIKHEKKSPADRFDTDRQNQFKTTNENNKDEEIDLYQNTTANINKMGAAGECLNLLDYIDYMPNFKAYLDANPVIEDQMTVEGKIYYTPYMDGSNYYERMFQMDAAMTKKLLDNGKDAGFDTTSAVDANRVNFTADKVTPFINDTKNYATDNYEVKICVDGKAETVKVKQTDNIIAKQNELLAGGCTGAELAQNFIDYLNTAYGNIEVNGTKVYSTLSKVFVGESAIYNTDDLIALFRVFRANPNYISGGKNDTIYPFQIRTSENNRVANVLSLTGHLFGVQGLNSEKDRLFFTTDGFWADAATEQQSYDALARMNALYQEGLILKGFQQGSKTQWGNNAFARNTDAATYGLMLNDYTAVPSKMNAKDTNNVGTSNQKAGYTPSELQPILAPITWWATKSFTHNQALTNKDGKTLTRYFEEIRSLKDESWCVPSNSDNKLAAVKLMDYLMSKEGQVYYDFCTEDYWATDSTNTSGEFPGYVEFTYGGDTTPQLKQDVLDWYVSSPIKDFNDFWKFMRGALGCTFGIGYIRTSTIDYQSTNLVARGGADALKAATNAGVNLKPNLISEVKFGTAVPAAGYPEITDEIAKTYDAVTQFWAENGKGQVTDSYGWVAAVQDPNFGDSTVLGTLSQAAGSGQYTFANVKEQFDARNKSYLKKYADYYSQVGLDIGKGYGKTPSYAK